MHVQPFPFGALPALSRVDLLARAALQSRLPPLELAQVSAIATQVLQTPIELRAREARRRPAQIGTPGDVGLIVRAVGAEPTHAMLIEMEGAFAATTVAIALRGRAPLVYDTTQVPSLRVMGAAAAVVQTILRRVLPEPIEVLTVGAAHALAADLHRQMGALCTWIGAATLESTQYSLRVTCLPNVLDAPAGSRWRTRLTPLSVPVVRARVTVPRAELAQLAIGDALLLPDDGARWLAPPQGEWGWRVTLDGDRVTVGEEVETLAWTDGDEMNEGFQEALGDLPVVVRVEVGSVQTTAKRWGELAPGDTLTLGTKVGAPVTLRVAGVEVALGELVQVEGEIAVRITKRLDLPGDPTTPR